MQLLGFLVWRVVITISQCCRCYDSTAPCWPSAPQWQALNSSVGGRLRNETGKLDACVSGTVSACNALQAIMANNYNSTDMNLIHATGNYLLFDGFKDSADIVVYASNAADIATVINFTQQNKLRLVVKNTGHDWYGRTLANPALELNTHNMQNITWHDAYTTCEGQQLQHAFTVQAGVRWRDIVPELQRRGRYTPYSTSMPVGAAGGFVQGGGFSPITGQFGSAADNVRKMTVVTADGVTRTANGCNENKDLFWALRGGGGGTFGVVVDVTYETYPAWSSLLVTYFRINAGSANPSVIRRKFVEFFGGLDQSRFSFVYCDFTQTTISLLGWANTLTSDQAGAVWLPLIQWLQAVGAKMEQTLDKVHWFQVNSLGFSPYPVNSATGKVWLVQELESNSKAQPQAYGVPPAYWHNEVGFQVSQDHWLNGSFADWLNTVAFGGGVSGVNYLHMDMTKALSGKFLYSNNQTSLNPSVYDAIGHVYTIPNNPDVSGFSPSSVKGTWSAQLQACVSPSTPLNLTECFDRFADSHAHDCLAAKAAEWFPRAGSYINENDPRNPFWRESQWGVNYQPLKAIKTKYDPLGLFVCHHCVNSEQYVMVEQSRGFCLRHQDGPNASDCPLFSSTADLGEKVNISSISSLANRVVERVLDLAQLHCSYSPDPMAFNNTQGYYSQVKATLTTTTTGATTTAPDRAFICFPNSTLVSRNTYHDPTTNSTVECGTANAYCLDRTHNCGDQATMRLFFLTSTQCCYSEPVTTPAPNSTETTTDVLHVKPQGAANAAIANAPAFLVVFLVFLICYHAS